MSDTVILGRRTATPASGFDPDTRTLSFVAATENPCPATRFDAGEEIIVSEILVASGCSNVDVMTGPLLDTHDRGSLSKVLGKLQGGRVKGATIVGTALLSDRPDVRSAVYPDLRDGIIDHVSVGYTCLREEWDRSTTPFTVRVTEWTADEVSLVPIPADESARIRSARAAAAPTQIQEITMDPTLEAALRALTESATAIATGVRAMAAQSATRAAPKADPKADPEPKPDAEPEADAKGTKSKRGKREDGEEEGGEGEGGEGDGDDMGGEDSDERKRAIADLVSAMGARKSEAFAAGVRTKLPLKALRTLAVEALTTRSATKVITPPAAVVADNKGEGKRQQAFVGFHQRGGYGPAAK